MAERDLWQAVVTLAISDATSTSDSYQAKIERRNAQDWITSNGWHFKFVCTQAGLDPEAVRDRYMSGQIAKTRGRGMMTPPLAV